MSACDEDLVEVDTPYGTERMTRQAIRSAFAPAYQLQRVSPGGKRLFIQRFEHDGQRLNPYRDAVRQAKWRTGRLEVVEIDCGGRVTVTFDSEGRGGCQ